MESDGVRLRPSVRCPAQAPLRRHLPGIKAAEWAVSRLAAALSASCLHLEA
jgi:hypothetical protein